MSLTKELTTEEIATKYGKVPLMFWSYYKFSFTFMGHLDDGRTIKACCGGSSDGIYKRTVEADTPEFIGDTPDETWNSIYIESSGNVVAEWHSPNY